MLCRDGVYAWFEDVLVVVVFSSYNPYGIASWCRTGICFALYLRQAVQVIDVVITCKPFVVESVLVCMWLVQVSCNVVDSYRQRCFRYRKRSCDWCSLIYIVVAALCGGDICRTCGDDGHCVAFDGGDGSVAAGVCDGEPCIGRSWQIKCFVTIHFCWELLCGDDLRLLPLFLKGEGGFYVGELLFCGFPCDKLDVFGCYRVCATLIGVGSKYEGEDVAFVIGNGCVSCRMAYEAIGVVGDEAACDVVGALGTRS